MSVRSSPMALSFFCPGAHAAMAKSIMDAGSNKDFFIFNINNFRVTCRNAGAIGRIISLNGRVLRVELFACGRMLFVKMLAGYVR